MDDDFCHNCHWLTLKKEELELQMQFLNEDKHKLEAAIQGLNDLVEAHEKGKAKLLAVVEAAEIMREDFEGVDWLSPGAQAYDKAKAEL